MHEGSEFIFQNTKFHSSCLNLKGPHVFNDLRVNIKTKKSILPVRGSSIGPHHTTLLLIIFFEQFLRCCCLFPQQLISDKSMCWGFSLELKWKTQLHAFSLFDYKPTLLETEIDVCASEKPNSVQENLQFLILYRSKCQTFFYQVKGFPRPPCLYSFTVCATKRINFLIHCEVRSPRLHFSSKFHSAMQQNVLYSTVVHHLFSSLSILATWTSQTRLALKKRFSMHCFNNVKSFGYLFQFVFQCE